MNAQTTRVVFFLLCVLTVVACSGFSALLLVAARISRRPAPQSRLRTISFTLLAFGSCCFGYALFIEADWIEVTHVTVQTPKWPVGRVLRVAHLSDLHVDRQSRALSRLVEELREEKVDLIVFTGDSLNRAESAPLFRSILGGLPSRLGRVAVRGNHDVYRWGKVDLFGGGIATELLSDAPLLLDDGMVAVCGAPFAATEGVDHCLSTAPPGAFVLFAYHSPDLIESLPGEVDLYLAGHTHGGQVAMPLYGALVTMSNFDKKYEAGQYHVGKTTLYVNRGIGFEPHMPRVRFFARPELTIIEVVGVGLVNPR